MTERQSASTGRFLIGVAAAFVVAATIALPDVWLRAAPAPPVPEGVFASGRSQVREWVCVNADCFFATDSLVTRRHDGGQVVEWVINPENPLTDIPLTAEGREEQVEIVDIRAVEDTLYLQLRSGRIVSRNRDGVWRPATSEFREVMGTAMVIAAVTATAVVAISWARSRRVSSAVLVVAGAAAILAHLPVTIWRHTTSFSLSSAAVLSLLFIVGSLVTGSLVAGPKQQDVAKRYIAGI